MNPLRRWLRFNFVGAAGIVVQLSALALFNRISHGHYLISSAAALELTLLHNFTWHLHFTWRDRAASHWLPQLVRFQLSNGLISLVGNLALMRVLVQCAHLRPVLANLVAIVCCSLINFYVGHTWAFAERSRVRLGARNAERLPCSYARGSGEKGASQPHVRQEAV